MNTYKQRLEILNYWQLKITAHPSWLHSWSFLSAEIWRFLWLLDSHLNFLAENRKKIVPSINSKLYEWKIKSLKNSRQLESTCDWISWSWDSRLGSIDRTRTVHGTTSKNKAACLRDHSDILVWLPGPIPPRPGLSLTWRSSNTSYLKQKKINN